MTMLERAARVLAASFGDDWDDLSEEIRESLRDDIRAVLQAIRTPSERVIEAGVIVMDPDYSTATMADAGWRAMIDSVLSD
jgi:hypothetical protein